MPEVRRAAHGVVWFEDPEPIHRLMMLQSSAMRSAYRAIHDHGLRGNSIRKRVKENYMDDLNQRYVNDSCDRAKSIRHDGVIFGGRANWDALNSGDMSKDEWLAIRNSQLYSRGDASQSGNPNIRIVDGELHVNDPSTRGAWIVGDLHLPEKFGIDTTCYDARLTRRDDGRFDVTFTWTEDVPSIDVVPGAIGVDTNPDGFAVAEVDGEGNLMGHTFLSCDRIRFASTDKRTNDVRLLALEVVEAATAARKPIVLEQLNFKSRKKAWKKFNRMASNFLHRRMIEAVRRAAEARGIPVVEVNPAFTSVLGILKYADVYSLNRHTAAAMVIARRGIGIDERMTFEISESEGSTEKLNLEGRGFSEELTPRAWSWMREGFLKQDPSSRDRHPCRTKCGRRDEPGLDPPGAIVEHNWSSTSAPRGVVKATKGAGSGLQTFS
jgi:IS605 OrfB family transposase